MNKSNSSDLVRDRQITTAMVVVQIIMAIFLACVVWIVTGFNPVACLLAGVLGWSLVLFKMSVFDWFFVNVPPNTVLILGNQMKYDVVPDRLTENQEGRDPRTTMFDLRSLREVGPGIRGKLPWEKPYESVDLRAEIVIGNNGDKKPPLVCYTKFNISLKIVWQVVLTPLRGSCVNLVRKGEKALVDFFSGYFEQYIIGWIKSQEEAEIFAELGANESLKKAFINALGGSNKVDPIEEEYGLFTNTPQIIRLERSESYERAAEGGRVAEQINEALGKLRESIPGADPNMVLALVAALTGKPLDGVVLIPGISGNPDALKAIAAIQQGMNKQKKG